MVKQCSVSKAFGKEDIHFNKLYCIFATNISIPSLLSRLESLVNNLLVKNTNFKKYVIMGNKAGRPVIFGASQNGTYL